MNILAIDSSTSIACVAVGAGDKIKYECLLNDKNTHSQKLLPLIDKALSSCEMTIDDIKEYIFPHPSVAEIIREAIFMIKE